MEYDGGRRQLQFGFSTVEPIMIEPRREPWLNHGSLREKNMVFQLWFNHGFFSVGCNTTMHTTFHIFHTQISNYSSYVGRKIVFDVLVRSEPV